MVNILVGSLRDVTDMDRKEYSGGISYHFNLPLNGLSRKWTIKSINNQSKSLSNNE